MIAEIGFDIVEFRARLWFARIMLTWGVLSFLFAFVRNTSEFLALRFFLSVAEAGFFPGVMLFLTAWFPSAYRARMISAFAVAIPASTALGAPLSTLILGLDGAFGLHRLAVTVHSRGPAVAGTGLPGAAAARRFTGPSSMAIRGANPWLGSTLRDERAALPAANPHGKWYVLRSPRIWTLGFVYCGIVAANYGVTFFLPQIVRAFGVSITEVGLLSALPFAAGAAGMLWRGARSDRLLERRWHLLIPGAVAAIALVASAATSNPAVKMTALTLAGFGAFANLPVFWALTSAMLPESDAPACIAVVSSIGNIGGFAAPYVVGALRQATGAYASGMLALTSFEALTVLVAAVMLRPPSKRAPWQFCFNSVVSSHIMHNASCLL